MQVVMRLTLVALFLIWTLLTTWMLRLRCLGTYAVSVLVTSVILVVLLVRTAQWYTVVCRAVKGLVNSDVGNLLLGLVTLTLIILLLWNVTMRLVILGL